MNNYFNYIFILSQYCKHAVIIVGDMIKFNYYKIINMKDNRKNARDYNQK